MSSSGKGDANSYWPGFVDALTNVVIAMIFVVVVLAISLSFAAQLMGKKMAEQHIKEMTEKAASKVAEPVQTPVSAPPPEGMKSDENSKEVIEPAPPKTAAVPRTMPNAGVKVDERIAVVGNEQAASAASVGVERQANVLQLDYAPGAVTLDPQALDRLKKALAAIGPEATGRSVQIVASGPDMVFSDNQRAAFTRVMAVRNALLDAGFNADRITMSVDIQRSAPAPAVNLQFVAAP